MRQMTSLARSAAVAAVLLVWACDGAEKDAGAIIVPGAGASTATGGSGDFGSSDDGPGAGGGAPVEEEEDETSFRAPVLSGRFLFSANPESGRVALIDTESKGVQIFSAGVLPTEVFAVPSADGSPSALVQNHGSSDASLFREVSGEISQTHIPTHDGANRWTISSSGKWGLAWSVARPGVELDPTEGLQEVTLAKLSSAAKPTRLAVGYRPSQVQISKDDKRAIVVSDEGLSLVDLSTPTPEVSAWLELGSGEGRDVSLSADGSYALVRRAGSTDVSIYELSEFTLAATVTMASAVTDVDITPQGRAVCVARESGEVALFDVADAAGDSNSVTRFTVADAIVGSAALAPNGESAVLYTTTTADSNVAVVDLSAATARIVDVRMPVGSAVLSPDGKHAVIIPPDGLPGFTVLSLATERFPRVVTTNSQVAQVALSNGAALVTVRATGSSPEAFVARLPALDVSAVTLASAPLAAGIVAETGLGFVAQDHPLGRVTFLDLESTGAQTLTGYELAAEVVEQ